MMIENRYANLSKYSVKDAVARRLASQRTQCNDVDTTLDSPIVNGCLINAARSFVDEQQRMAAMFRRRRSRGDGGSTLPACTDLQQYEQYLCKQSCFQVRCIGLLQ